jgi:hypothetical protein
MSLSSQSLPGPTQDKPPVPLFAEAAGGAAGTGGPPVSSQQLPLGPPQAPAPQQQQQQQMDIPLSQQDYLGTQDYITPNDQFNLDYDPRDAKRSPARLTPNRVKRPRQSGAGASLGWDRGRLVDFALIQLTHLTWAVAT